MKNKTKSIVCKNCMLLFWLFLLFFPSFVFSQQPTTVTMDQFIGANVRRGDPIGKFTAVSFIREYHDWVLDEGFVANGDSPGYPGNKYKWNLPSYSNQTDVSFDAWYDEVFQDGYTILPSMINSPPYIIDNNIFCLGGAPCPYVPTIMEQKPIYQYTNSDPIPIPHTMVHGDPFAYTAHADHLYHFTARYGSQPQSAYSGAEWNNITNKLHSDETVLVGQSKIQYIENFNEPDKYWHITRANAPKFNTFFIICFV